MSDVIDHDQPDAQPRPSTALQVFRQDLAAMSAQFAAALPSHVPVERFARVVQTAVQQNPDILRCDRRSVWNAAMKAAQYGLLPDGREGAIVPFQGTATFMAMVAGIRKMSRNSGEISTWDVYDVRQGDDFEFELGDDPYIKHRPALTNRGPMIAVYSICKLKDGSISRDIMSVGDVERIRDRSIAWKAYQAKKIRSTPWATDFEEMAKKTVAKRHSKVLPASTDLDDLIRRDDELYRHDEAAEQSREMKRPTLAGALDQLAGMPAEPAPEDTGEQAGNDAAEGTAEVETAASDAPAGEQADFPGDRPSAETDEPKDEADAASAKDAHVKGREAGLKGVAASAIPKGIADRPLYRAAWLAGHVEGLAERKGGKP